jgi:N-acetylmuramoyl-L-alanine amidase
VSRHLRSGDANAIMWNVRATTLLATLLVLVLASPPHAQDASPTPLTLVSRDGRRTVPTVLQGGREMVALDEVAGLFQVSVKEDTLAGGITVSYRGRTIVASANRLLVSVDGRVVTLPSPVVRSGRRWLVPIEFLSTALASIYDQRIELRRTSRLLVVGDVRLPRVTAYIDSGGRATRAAIEIAPSAGATVTPEAGRLVVRIDADALDLALPPSGGGLIERIRSGDQPNLLVVALTSAAGPGRATVTTTGNVTRVLVEVPPAVSAETRPASPDPRLPAPEPRLPIPDPRVLATPSRTWRTIVLDPGHGGDDPGVRGARGAEEKHITLDVARRLRTMVETRLGLRVILTRDDDRTVGLDERAAMANNGKADLLLSLHVNGSRAPDQAGAEVFHLQLDRESEEVVRAAAVEGLALPSLGGGVRRLDLIPWDLAQARHLEESAVLAGVLQEELQRQVPVSDRPLRQAPIRLLAAANMPAALIEMAYLTNPAQAAQLRGEDFKANVAQAVFSAIVRFRAWSEESRRP